MESSFQDLHFNKQIILEGRQSIGPTKNGDIEYIYIAILYLKDQFSHWSHTIFQYIFQYTYEVVVSNPKFYLYKYPKLIFLFLLNLLDIYDLVKLIYIHR